MTMETRIGALCRLLLGSESSDIIDQFEIDIELTRNRSRCTDTVCAGPHTVMTSGAISNHVSCLLDVITMWDGAERNLCSMKQ